MIAFDAVVLEDLLHRDADWRAAAPDSDQKRRPEAAANDLQSEFDRIAQERIGRNKVFIQGLRLHRCSRSCLVSPASCLMSAQSIQQPLGIDVSQQQAA